MTTSASRLRVGQSASFNCESDLNPTSITWYKEDGTVVTSTNGSSNQMLLNPVSTDDEGRVFTCEANSQYGSQERSISLSTFGNNNFLLPSKLHVCLDK